jgi:hypothetical protein
LQEGDESEQTIRLLENELMKSSEKLKMFEKLREES